MTTAQQPDAAAAATFARGDLVWGHCRGFPWWPCQVRSIRKLSKPAEGEEPKLRLRFLHTGENAELPPARVLPYAGPHVAELSVLDKKKLKSPGMRAKFEAAVREAAAWHERGGPPPREPGAPAEAWSDDDHIDEDDIAAAAEEAAAWAARNKDLWRDSGHELVGKHVARYFGHDVQHMRKSDALKARKAYLAVVTRWLPAEDEQLFHVVHDDGDEEDLEEHEVRKAVALYQRQPEPARRKHEKHVARLERQRRAEAKARQPKRPRSAYLCFADARRPALMAAQPGLSFVDLNKQLAAAWREVDDAAREVFCLLYTSPSPRDS